MFTPSSTRLYDRFHYKIIEPPAGEQLTLAEVRDHLRLISYACSPPLHEEDLWLTAAISTAREWCEGVIMAALATQTLELGIAMFPTAEAAGETVGDITAGTPLAASPYTWDNGIMLPFASPLQAVLSVTYDDGSGTPMVMDPSAYYADDYSRPARVYPAPGSSWPVAQVGNRRGLRIRYRCGYALPGESPPTPACPFAIKAAMLLVVGHLHENRENSQEVKPEEIPLGAKALLSRYSARLWIA